MASILTEFEGLTKNRIKTVMKKVDHCGFNTLVTHIQVQCTDFDRELTIQEQQEDSFDIQPVQPNSIYIKCELLDSASKYIGKGDVQKIATKRAMSPHIKLMASNRSNKTKPIEAILPTESPIEDEIENFDLVVRKDIVFYNPSKSECIGFYNAKANILWISDLVHNPMRAESLLDRALSYVYEFQKTGSLNTITPIFEKYQKDLDKKGFINGALWWTGFESSRDTAYVDGRIDSKKFLEAQAEELIKAGVDIFFLRNLKNYERGAEIVVDKCKGKLTVTQPSYGQDQVQVPAHTTLEQELKAIEDYVTIYSTGVAKGFYDKAAKELKKVMGAANEETQE